MSAYYIKEIYLGDEYRGLMQARTRAEALEELRAMWNDMPATDRMLRSSYTCIEVSVNDYTDEERVSWEGPDMTVNSWCVQAFKVSADGAVYDSQLTYCSSYDECLDAASAAMWSGKDCAEICALSIKHLAWEPVLVVRGEQYGKTD